MTVHEPHRTSSSVPTPAPGHPLAAAAAGAILAVCIYHIIPGGTVADDALRAVCAALVCATVLACLRRDSTTGERIGACALALGGLALWGCGLLACGAGTLGTSGVLGTAGACSLLAASCLGTAVWEEVLFRRLLPDAFATQLGSAPLQRLLCAVVCAALFGLLHLGGTGGAGALAATGEAPAIGAPAARFAQTALFGLVMAGVVTCRGGLMAAVALHGAYDLVGFAAGVAQSAGGFGPALLAQPAQSFLSVFVSPGGMAASIAICVPLAAWSCARLLRQP